MSVLNEFCEQFFSLCDLKMDIEVFGIVVENRFGIFFWVDLYQECDGVLCVQWFGVGEFDKVVRRFKEIV